MATIAASTLICRFVIEGLRPVAWSVPKRMGVKRSALRSWQGRIAAEAALVVDRRKPAWAGPVGLRLTFTLAPRAGHEGIPDLSNLQKGAEDALQGVAFVNDTQVCAIDSVRVFGAENRTEIEVYALAETEESS